jgi:hypothetical protein
MKRGFQQNNRWFPEKQDICHNRSLRKKLPDIERNAVENKKK